MSIIFLRPYLAHTEKNGQAAAFAKVSSGQASGLPLQELILILLTFTVYLNPHL